MKTKFKYRDPSITLVGSYDGRERAWRHSRPHLKQDDPVMQDIENLNLPVNGFAVYHFEITAPLIIRDLFYMIRPSNDWARSSRAELLTEDTITYSSEFKDFLESSDLALDSHNKSLDFSLPQDERKKYFLYAFMSDFSFMVNARVLSNLIYTLEDTIFDNYAQLFKSALKDIKLVPHNKSKLWDSLMLPIEICRPMKKGIIPPVSVIDNRLSGQVTVTALMTGNLSSQFQRQESGIVRSSLVNMIYNAKNISELPISQAERLVSQITISKDTAYKIIKTRADWFAQMDNDDISSWSNIIAKMIEVLNPDVSDIIPCGKDHTKCPWLVNQLNTLYGGNPNYKGDVNLPCPFITGIPEVYDLRVKKFGKASAMLARWKDWIPKKLELTDYGRQFLANICKYGYAEKCDTEKLSKDTEKLLRKYRDQFSLDDIK